MKIGYLRVSTKGQRPDRQINGLKGLCDKLHIEKLSAVAAKRPVFDKLMQNLRYGDSFIVWDLDRAFRSTEDAIVHERMFRENGIEFITVNIEINTSTADGNHEFQTRAAAAERERKKISERTIEGLKEAVKRGSQLGRPPKLTNKQILLAKNQIQAGVTIKKLAARYGVAPWTITRSIKRLEEKA